MSATVVSVYNMALAAIGTVARLQLPTDIGPEAAQCNLWYADVRDQILRSAPWDCAKAHVYLGVSSEKTDDASWVETDPAPGWRFAYGMPSNALAPRYIAESYARFEIGINSNDQKVLYTNQQQAILCYTKRQTRVDVWESDLRAAVAFGLAAHIGMKLTGSQEKVRFVTAQAIDKILAARQNSANMPNFGLESVPEWIAARGYAQIAPATPYIYPWAEFSVATLPSFNS